MRDVVNSSRSVFDAAHAPDAVPGSGIALSDFEKSAAALSLHLPHETLAAMCAAADVDGNHVIDFKAR